MKKISILIADDHALMRFGLKSLIATQPDMDVCGEADDGEKAVRLAKKLKPDVIIMDLMMPVLSGVEATRRILDGDPTAKIVILTSFGGSVDLQQALAAGALGAQLKESRMDNVLKAIRAVSRGKSAVDPEVQTDIDTMPNPIVLTTRQQEILKAAALGKTTDQIAAACGISASAVKQHISAIMRNLGAASRSEAIAVALSRNLLKI